MPLDSFRSTVKTWVLASGNQPALPEWKRCRCQTEDLAGVGRGRRRTTRQVWEVGAWTWKQNGALIWSQEVWMVLLWLKTSFGSFQAAQNTHQLLTPQPSRLLLSRWPGYRPSGFSRQAAGCCLPTSWPRPPAHELMKT